MKYFAFLLYFFSIIIHGQSYQPTLTEGAFWDVGLYNQDNLLGCLENIRRYDLGETLEINGHEYREVRVHGFSYEEDYPCPSEYPDLSAYPDYSLTGVFIREDITEKKLYVWSDQVTGTYQEFLLCDFSLEIGDQIINPYILDESDVFITNIYSSDGIKTYETNICGYSYSEGIGGSSGIISPIVCQFEYFDTLFCHGDSESNICSGYLDITQQNLSSIKIFPNPVKDELSINTDLPLEIRLYNLLGTEIRSTTIYKNSIIDLSDLSKGIYLLKTSVQNKGNKVDKTFKIIKE